VDTPLEASSQEDSRLYVVVAGWSEKHFVPLERSMLPELDPSEDELSLQQENNYFTHSKYNAVVTVKKSSLRFKIIHAQ